MGRLCDVCCVEAVVVRVFAVTVFHREHETHEGRCRNLKSVEQVALLEGPSCTHKRAVQFLVDVGYLVNLEVDAREHPLLHDKVAGSEDVQAPCIDAGQRLNCHGR